MAGRYPFDTTSDSADQVRGRSGPATGSQTTLEFNRVRCKVTELLTDARTELRGIARPTSDHEGALMYVQAALDMLNPEQPTGQSGNH